MRLLLVCGNSQVGKSSFINTISGCTKAEVGSEEGQSTTRDLKYYHSASSRILFKSDPENSELYIIDIPGFQDSDFAITDEEILKLITEKLFEFNKDHLDAIIVFESVMASSISILQTTHKLMQIFGSEVESSIIVLTTKWDLLTNKQKQTREMGYAKFNKFIQVKWINSTSDIYDDSIKNIQFEELSSALSKKNKLNFMKIKELEKICNERAIRLMNDTPEKERYNIEKVVHQISKPIKRINKIPYDVVEDAYPNYSSLRNRAEYLRNQAGKISRTVSETFTKPVWKSDATYEKDYKQQSYTYTVWILFVPVKKTGYKWVPYWKPIPGWVDETTTITKTVYEDRDIDIFMNMARSEKKKITKYKEVTVDDFELVDQEEIIKTEKNPFEYYYNRVKNEMVEEFRKICKAKIS